MVSQILPGYYPAASRKTYEKFYAHAEVFVRCFFYVEKVTEIFEEKTEKKV